MTVLSLDKLHRTYRGLTIEVIKKSFKAATIIDKIRYSGITREDLRKQIEHLETVQVPNRTVLLNMSDAAVTEYWFKNWLHPRLLNVSYPSPRDKRGCSREVLKRDAELDMIHFYENGQHQFKYTLADIKAYINAPTKPYLWAGKRADLSAYDVAVLRNVCATITEVDESTADRNTALNDAFQTIGAEIIAESDAAIDAAMELFQRCTLNDQNKVLEATGFTGMATQENVRNHFDTLELLDLLEAAVSDMQDSIDTNGEYNG